jgi:hypothetical protein
MVSFIADPRIKQAQAQRQALMAQALTPYQLPANPYGASPWAGNLQRLAAALGARWAGQDAAKLKKGQQQARSDIQSRILEQGQIPAGRPTYEIRDDGRYIPLQYAKSAVSFDPATLERAGTTAPAAQIGVRQMQELAKKRFEDQRTIQLQQALIEAESDDVRQAIRLALDPVAATAPRPQDTYTHVSDEGIVTVINKIKGIVTTLTPDPDGQMQVLSVSRIGGESGKQEPSEVENGGEIAVDRALPPAKPAVKKARTRDEIKIANKWAELDIKSKEKRLAEWPKFIAGFETARENYRRDIKAVNEAIDIVTSHPNATGLISMAVQVHPESPAHRLEKLLDNLRAKGGFQTLMDLKAASETGGALGAINTRELDLLIVRAFYGAKEQGAERLLPDLEEYRTWLIQSQAIAERLHNNWRSILQISEKGGLVPKGSVDVPESGASDALKRAQHKYGDQ